MRPRCSLPPSRKGAAGKARGEMGECDRATERVKLGTHFGYAVARAEKRRGFSLWDFEKSGRDL